MPNQTRNAKAILLVDDEQQTLKYFQKTLGGAFSILTASSADEAETIVAENGDNIGVVITDQRMPSRDGVSLLNAVRKSNPQIVRILTTAYADLSSAIDAVNKGEIFRYITKPWDFEQLEQELKIALYVYELQNERDLLLTEKLSVRSRMRASDRISTLLAISNAWPNPTPNLLALRGYVRQMAAVPPQTLNQVPASDNSLWSAEQNETRSLGALAAKIGHLNRLAQPTPRTAHNVTYLLSELNKAGIQVTGDVGGPAGSDAEKTELYQLLAENLATGIRQWTPVDGRKVTAEASMSGTDSNGSLQVNIVTSDISDHSDDLLFDEIDDNSILNKGALYLSYLAAALLGGSIERSVSGTSASLTLYLPVSEQIVPANVDLDEIINEIFQSLESWD